MLDVGSLFGNVFLGAQVRQTDGSSSSGKQTGRADGLRIFSREE